MNQTGTRNEHPDLEALGLSGTGRVFWNLGPAALCERAVARGEGRLSDTGALVVSTAHSDRLARVRVRDADTESPAGVEDDATLPREQFEALKADLLAHAAARTLFAHDLRADVGPDRSVGLRLLSEQAWHGLMARNLMRTPEGTEPAPAPELTVICASGFRPDLAAHGVDGAAVALDLANGLALIAGTARTDAIREVVFAFLAETLPAQDALPLHGAATAGAGGDVALFLGAAGAGKTALTTAAGRTRIADDALAWTADGLVSLESGTRVRAADLAAPSDLDAVARRFGVVLENVALDPDTRVPDFADAATAHLAHATLPGEGPGKGGTPAHLFLLMHDTAGVLPPLAGLTPAQALYHFLSGYGARATEDEAEPAFVPGFAAGMPPQALAAHGRRLRDLLNQHTPACWLVNTGWIGGAAGRGQRVPLDVTRRLVDAALTGELAAGEWRTDPHFGFAVPGALEGIEPRLLDPARSWPGRIDHAMAARRLVGLFNANFARFEPAFGEDVRGAQPGMALAAE